MKNTAILSIYTHMFYHIKKIKTLLTNEKHWELPFSEQKKKEEVRTEISYIDPRGPRKRVGLNEPLKTNYWSGN
jgi:hypothetical protein